MPEPRAPTTAAVVKAAAPAAADPTKRAARLKRNADNRRARRAAARQGKAGNGHDNPNGAGKNGKGTGGNASAEPTAQALWGKAEMLMPKTPWRAVARACGANEAACLDAFRTRAMPPGVATGAVARFLELPVSAG
jgi:hypothetical protein